jgi:hypothetical protein
MVYAKPWNRNRRRHQEQDMTKEELIRMADQAFDESSVTDLEVLRFAALVAAAERERAIAIANDMKEKLQARFEQTYMEGVIAGAAAEREACAKVCEEYETENDITAMWLNIVADAIRAMGKT